MNKGLLNLQITLEKAIAKDLRKGETNVFGASKKLTVFCNITKFSYIIKTLVLFTH